MFYCSLSSSGKWLNHINQTFQTYLPSAWGQIWSVLAQKYFLDKFWDMILKQKLLYLMAAFVTDLNFFIIKIYGKLYSLNIIFNYAILYIIWAFSLHYSDTFVGLKLIYFSKLNFFCLIATTDQQAASFEMEMSQAGFSAHYSQVNKLFENKSSFMKQICFFGWRH